MNTYLKLLIEKPGRSKPDTPQRLDFQQLYIKEITEILRKLGTDLINRLLAGHPPPLLTSLLTGKDILTLSQSYIWKLIRHRKSRKGERPKILKDLIFSLLADSISAAGWQEEACERVALAIGGTPGDGLPDVLWPVAAEAAWQEPGFLYKTAWDVFQYLRNEELFSPYQTPNIEFSHGTYWVLIALALPKRLTLAQWFSRGQRRTLNAVKCLQEEARRQVMVEGWAHFWDQWLLKRAVKSWPSAFIHPDRRFFESLTGLPLLAGSVDIFMLRQSREPKTRIGKMLRKLSQFIDKIKNSMGLLKPRETGLDLSDPKWKEQVPDFIKDAGALR
jgi:hypothetical protein